MENDQRQEILDLLTARIALASGLRPDLAIKCDRMEFEDVAIGGKYNPPKPNLDLARDVINHCAGMIPANEPWSETDSTMLLNLIRRLRKLDEVSVQLRNELIIKACLWLADQQGVPRELFLYRLMAGFGINASIETIICYFDSRRGWMVLLVRRDSDDPDYPGRPWHGMGNIILKGKSHEEQLAGVLKKENPNLPEGKIEFAGVVELTSYHRGAGEKLPGHWILLLFMRILPERPADGEYVGEFFPITELPEDTVYSHLNGVFPVAQHFLAYGMPEYRELRPYNISGTPEAQG